MVAVLFINGFIKQEYALRLVIIRKKVISLRTYLQSNVWIDAIPCTNL